MTTRTAALLPRPRTLVHPGAFNPIRIHSRRVERGTHHRLTLQPGMSLYDGLVRPLAEIGVKNASTTILGGFFESLDYCVAPPDPTGRSLIAYSSPIRVANAYMVFGNATIGKNQQGKPIVHCHAAIHTESGWARGGHIMTDTSIVGPEPISVLVTAFHGFDLRVTYDPETNIPLIQPQEEEPHNV
jgi:predicted DNA-binding protein with PD1-like motif